MQPDGDIARAVVEEAVSNFVRGQEPSPPALHFIESRSAPPSPAPTWRRIDRNVETIAGPRRKGGLASASSSTEIGTPDTKSATAEHAREIKPQIVVLMNRSTYRAS
jgi:hypothetical protein